jgi:hypothetical protein
MLPNARVLYCSATGVSEVRESQQDTSVQQFLYLSSSWHGWHLYQQLSVQQP